MNNDELVSTLQRVIATEIAEINTSAPGVIVSYNATTKMAVVRPLVSKRLADGTDLPAPEIHNVLVQMPGGGGMQMNIPMKPGDEVQLHFAQRSLDSWLSNSEQSPDDPRTHDLSDCTASPGLRNTTMPGHPDNFIIEFGGASIFITPDGSINFKVAGGTITIYPSGIMSSSQDIKAQTISLINHKHTSVQPGSGISGVPQS